MIVFLFDNLSLLDHGNNENLTLSCTSDVSNMLSQHNSVVVNDAHQVCFIEFERKLCYRRENSF